MVVAPDRHTVIVPGLRPAAHRSQARGAEDATRVNGRAPPAGITKRVGISCPTRSADATLRRARLCRLKIGSAGVPTADSPSPAGQRGRRCPGLSAGVQACTACSCRICPPPACGAMPEASRASRERPRPSACAGQAAPARQATPGQPTRTAPGRRAAAVRRSYAGAPAAPHPSPSRRGTTGRPS